MLDAFNERGIVPEVALETMSTETVISMVEGGLGLSIVPLLSTGAVTRGRRVDVFRLDAGIRPIHSGVLLRRGETPSPAARQLLEFTKQQFS